jgi:hypothetical protein
MKVTNLADYPLQLGDGRVIGAAGTKQDTREYDLPELTKEDKKRVKEDTLAVVVEEPEEKPSDATENKSESSAVKTPVNQKAKEGGSK